MDRIRRQQALKGLIPCRGTQKSLSASKRSYGRKVVFIFLFMTSKKKKQDQIKASSADLEQSAAVVVADFTGTTASEMNQFRRLMQETGARVRVIKKRLLRLVFAKSGVEFTAKDLNGQAGVVFSPNDFVATAQAVYGFAKNHEKGFRLSAGMDLAAKKFFGAEEILVIGKLPTRSVLLGQLVGVLAGPIRNLMYVLQEKAKKVDLPSSSPAGGEPEAKNE